MKSVFDSEIGLRIPASWRPLITASAEQHQTTQAQWLREAIAAAITQQADEMELASRPPIFVERPVEFALVRIWNNELVDPMVPAGGNAIVTEWPEPVDGCEWWPVSTEPGKGKPTYRIEGKRVIRSFEDT